MAAMREKHRVRIRRGFSQKPSDDWSRALSRGPSIRGFCVACMSARATASQARIRGVVRDKSVPLGSTAAAAVGVFPFDRVARGYAGRRERSSGLCRCGVERVWPSQLPRSQVRDLAQLSREAVSIVAAIGISKPPLPNHVFRSSGGGRLASWLILHGPAVRRQSRVNRGALHERSNRRTLSPTMKVAFQCPGMADRSTSAADGKSDLRGAGSSCRLPGALRENTYRHAQCVSTRQVPVSTLHGPEH